MARTVNLSSLGDRFADRLEARPRSADDWIYLEGCEPWEAQEHLDARVSRGATELEAPHLKPTPLKLAVCPVCGNDGLGSSRYCLACDRAATDGRVTYPGLPVGSACDPEWKGEGTKYVPDRKLKGGVG